jgi:hypothetical protein
MADWKIAIVPGANPGDPPQFVCELQPAVPKGQLLAQAGDAIHWSNGTAQPQRPWPTDDNFKPLPPVQVQPTRGKQNSIYLSDVIPPGHSSRPTWIAFGNTGTQYKYTSWPDQHSAPSGQGIITITD